MTRRPAFACTACGATHSKWSGRCDACGAWNTIAEEAGLADGPAGRTLGPARGRRVALGDLAATEPPLPRALSGIARARPRPRRRPRPGLRHPRRRRPRHRQVHPAPAGRRRLRRRAAPPAVYVSGEEATAQIRMRAQRLGLADAPLRLAAETNLRDILTTLEAERPALAVIDSIQTMWADHVDSAPGSVAQVRAAAHELVTFAKRRGIARRPRRPRHQGRPDRRPARRRAHGRHRALLRGRARPPVPHPARGQEPLRPGRRDRRLRDDRRRPRRGRQPLRALPLRARQPPPRAPPSSPASRAPGRSSSRSRPSSPPPPPAPPAAPSSAGTAAASPWCSPSSNRAAASASARRTSTSTSPAACASPSPPPTSPSPRRWSPPAQDIPLPRDAVFFGEISLSGALRPAPQAEARLREAAKLGFAAACAPAARRRGR